MHPACSDARHVRAACGTGAHAALSETAAICQLAFVASSGASGASGVSGSSISSLISPLLLAATALRAR